MGSSPTGSSALAERAEQSHDVCTAWSRCLIRQTATRPSSQVPGSMQPEAWVPRAIVSAPASMLSPEFTQEDPAMHTAMQASPPLGGPLDLQTLFWCGRIAEKQKQLQSPLQHQGSLRSVVRAWRGVPEFSSAFQSTFVGKLRLGADWKYTNVGMLGLINSSC